MNATEKIMTQRLLLGLLVLAAEVCAQHRVDPKNMYRRVICVAPYIGQGTESDPVRPKYAPAPGADRRGILGYTQVASDDGKLAIVEFVARDAKVFDEILRDGQVISFVKGKNTKTEIETELRRYKRDFNLDHFGVVIP
jgi:hypothetical protein